MGLRLRPSVETREMKTQRHQYAVGAIKQWRSNFTGVRIVANKVLTPDTRCTRRPRVAFQLPNRPRNLDLRFIQFPVGALASFGHRLSGLFLVFSVSFLPGLLQASLNEPARIEIWRSNFEAPWGVALTFVFAWAFFHHLFAGLRHLLMDVGLGTSLRAARTSARLVIVSGAAAAFFCVVISRLP